MSNSAKQPDTPDGMQDLNYWVTELSSRQMPAFAHTAHAIAGQVQDESSSTAHLAREILQDPTMTARVLKMSNNVFHNPAQSKISTVSRAIVVLGFATVRRICMSIAFIDSSLAVSINPQVLIITESALFGSSTSSKSFIFN